MVYDKIIDELCETLCGKKWLRMSGFTQNDKYIYGSHWIEALHEICHYISASDIDKKEENLGWSNYTDFLEFDEYPKHLQIQEISALKLTHDIGKHIIDIVKIEEDSISTYLGYMLYMTADKEVVDTTETFNRYLVIIEGIIQYIQNK